MQSTILTLILFFTATLVFGKTKVVSSEILSQQATANLFTDSVCKQFGITYTIRRVYKCIEKSVQFFIVLTESNDTIGADKDTLNHNIKAFNFHQNKNGLLKKWEINDFITHQAIYLDVKDSS